MSYQEDAARYRQMVAHALDGYLANPGIPESLLLAMRYSINGGGKMLRPCLALAACEMLGGKANDALAVACALEMIHCYSLIHDDLPAMDDDDYRRGKPTNHKVFGEGMAILAGDGLLSYAFEVMLDALPASASHPGYVQAVRAVAKGAGVCGMVAGQAVDLASEADQQGSEARLTYVHAHKTGALIRAALLSGAHIAGADTGQLAALGGFGEAYGLLFQITDDVLDVEGAFANMGKTLGKDEKANKLTYVRFYGLNAAKRMAEETARQAEASLAVFGSSAQYFYELTDMTLRRDH